MRTFYKQSLAALFATALALGCGSSDKEKQQAKQPSPAPAQTSYVQTTGATTEAPSAGMGPSMQGSTSSTTPPSQPSSSGGGGPQDTTTGTSSDSQNADQASTTTTTGATMDTKVTTLTDGEVLAIENALNKGEITLAELARKQSVHADVKSFAGTVLTHHKEAQTKSAAIARKDKIVAKDDDASKTLQMDATNTLGDLKKRKGGDFDTAYIDSQVRMHRDAGTLIDNQLLPSVKNNALKDQLLGLRQTIADHQTKAENIQSHFETVGTTSTTGATMSGTKAKAQDQGQKKEQGTAKPKTTPPPKTTAEPKTTTPPKTAPQPKTTPPPKTAPPETLPPPPEF